MSVLPLDLMGPGAAGAGTMAGEIAAALWRLRWLTVAAPAGARYHGRGNVHSEPGGRVRASAVMIGAHCGRHPGADCFDGRGDDLFEFGEQAAVRMAHAIQPALRGAEIDRAWRRDRERPTAWGLTMRALPCVRSFEPASEASALELLEQAIEGVPHDRLPLAPASWCRGLRAGHHFAPRPQEERAMAPSLAARGAQRAACDPLAETLVAGGSTLAHDLATAAVHVHRALALDGGSAWAWGQSGWVKGCAGDPAEAIERCAIARGLAPADPLAFLWSMGIGAAHFEAARYHEAGGWSARGRAEPPTAVWKHRFLRRGISRAGAPRRHSLRGQVRRSEPARADADGHQPEASVLRDGFEHRARRAPRCHLTRGLLSRVAGFAHPAGEARRGRDSGLAMTPRGAGGPTRAVRGMLLGMEAVSGPCAPGWRPSRTAWRPDAGARARGPGRADLFASPEAKD